jgi:hypothetical protein
LLRPHRPLRRRPISGFPDVGMLQIHSPSIDTDEEGWRERAEGEKRAACLFFYVCCEELCGRAPPATSAAAHIQLF